ncbi:KCNH5, partial [Symbiodinium pilosum]
MRMMRPPRTLKTGSASLEPPEPQDPHPDASITSLFQRTGSSAESVNPGLDKYLKNLDAASIETFKLVEDLQIVIPELHPEHSPHVVFEQSAERERAESSCISIVALFKNRYDIFTHPQVPHARLDEGQWSEMQGLMSWIDPDVEQMQAVLVLLAIRALGKSKAVLQQMPAYMRRPEKAVLQLVGSEQNVVPSVRWLTEGGGRFLENALEIHQLFNLAQMLQGENLPANIAQLRKCIDEKSEEQFRFYILFLLGFMSGIAAGAGSRFMHSKNAASVISGIRLLKRLMECSPVAIYWGYLQERAHKLHMSFCSVEDLVLVRLSCLARVQDEKDYLQLRASWDALKARERAVLTEHFLADGIQEQAFMLEFLPNCVANAKANSTVGFAGLLGVLVDLLNNLRLSVDSMPDADQVIPVDLSEMADFIAVVQNRFVFLTCISRCRLQFVGQRVFLKMTGGNWGRTADADSDMTSLAYTLQ